MTEGRPKQEGGGAGNAGSEDEDQDGDVVPKPAKGGLFKGLFGGRPASPAVITRLRQRQPGCVCFLGLSAALGFGLGCAASLPSKPSPAYCIPAGR